MKNINYPENIWVNVVSAKYLTNTGLFEVKKVNTASTT